MTVSAGTTLTLADAFASVGSLDGLGTLNGGTGNVDIGGNFTVATYTGTTATSFVGGNYDVTTLTANGPFDFDTTSGATIDSNGQTFGTVFISANRTLAFALAAATLSIDSGAILTAGAFSLTVSGDAVDTTTGGSLTATTGAVSVSGNLTVQTVTVGAGGLAVIGLLDTASLTAGVGAGTVDVNGNFTVSGNLQRHRRDDVRGRRLQRGNPDRERRPDRLRRYCRHHDRGGAFGNVQISASKTMGGDWTAASLVIDAGDTLTTADNSISVTPGGITANGTLLASGQTVGGVTSAGDVIGTGTVTGGAGNIRTNANLSVATYNATGGITYIGGGFTSTSFANNNGTVELDGATPMNLTSRIFYNLRINKSAAGVVVTSTSGLTVTNGLVLTQGTWDAGTFIHTIANGWDSSSGTFFFAEGTSTVRLQGGSAPVTLRTKGIGAPVPEPAGLDRHRSGERA